MATQLLSIQVLLVEDQTAFASLLTLLLHEIGIKAVQVGHNVQQGLDLFLDHKSDICLLDIDLGKNQPSGIILAEEIRALDPHVPIIFLTSHYTNDFYEKVRHICPSGFMNKELSKLKLYQAIDLALMQVPDVAATPDAPALSPPFYFPSASNNHFFFKVDDQFKRIPVSEVAFFFSKDKLTYARVGNRNFPTNVQLKIIEGELVSSFVRIHKSFLVNIKMIDSINASENIVLVDKERLPIGHVYRKSFLEKVKLLK